MLCEAKKKMSNEKKTRQPIMNPAKSPLGFEAKNDGIDHINIYSNGETELGRLLTHFAHTPFIHPYLGPFASMEGLWFFIRNGGFDENLRYLSGIKAKKLGRLHQAKWYPDFRSDIIAANYQKIIQNDQLREAVIASELPFDHYYLFGPKKVLIAPRDSMWLIEGFEEIRKALKEGVVPKCWIDAEQRYISQL